jgi:small subunit ribosomal protein S20
VPNTRSAKKRMRQAARGRARNRPQRAALRTAVKKVRAAATGDEAAKAFRAAEAELDRAAGKGLIHRNTAARQKSRLAKAARKP